MKKSKLISAIASGVMLFGLVLVQNGCKDPCKDVECLNGGTCVEGDCECATGYEGTDCADEMRAKFISTYSVSDGCSTSGAATYDITVEKSSSAVNKVLIGNAWNTFVAKVVATVDGTTISIAAQQPDNDGFEISGSGTINGTKLTLNYTVTEKSTSATDVCQSTCTKK